MTENLSERRKGVRKLSNGVEAVLGPLIPVYQITNDCDGDLHVMFCEDRSAWSRTDRSRDW